MGVRDNGGKAGQRVVGELEARAMDIDVDHFSTQERSMLHIHLLVYALDKSWCSPVCGTLCICGRAVLRVGPGTGARQGVRGLVSSGQARLELCRRDGRCLSHSACR